MSSSTTQAFKNPRAKHNFQGRTCSISGVGSYVPDRILTNAEIEKMVTHTGIIHHGSMLFQGTMEELHRKQTAGAMIHFETGDLGKTANILLANGLASNLQNGQLTIPVVEKETIAMLTRQLVEAGVSVYQIHQVQSDLESIFIDLVK